MSGTECPCGSKLAEKQYDVAQTDYGPVLYVFHLCPDCGSEFATGEQINENARAMRELKAGKSEGAK